MVESSWLLTEGLAIALPTASAALWARRGRKQLGDALSAPLFWEGGHPISLSTLYNELNGEVDLPAAVGEAVGQAPPRTGPELARAVARLQAEPGLVRQLVLDLGTEFALRQAVPRPDHTAQAGAAIMERLARAHAEMGFFAFVAHLNAERPAGAPALLPIDALLPGGYPLETPDGHPNEASAGPGGMLGMLAALGLGRQDWLPGVMKVVEDLMRERRVKKAREQYHRALAVLGAAAADALRRRTPAGQQLRHNVYTPLDAYRNLATRLKAGRPAAGDPRRWLVPDVELALYRAFLLRLARATALVADKCGLLERTLLGRQGPAYAGEMLFRHREALLGATDARRSTSIAPDAFPVAAVQAALDEYLRLRDEGQTAEA